MCPRLTKYIGEVGKTKTKKYIDETYWAKPVPSFGDPNLNYWLLDWLLLPNGGNRTGRIFTGDSSGDWLVRASFETGFANKPTSISNDDGLILKDAYVTSCKVCSPTK